MDKNQIDVLKIYYGYFELHSRQRLSCFNYFIAISSIILGAYGNILLKNGGAFYFELLFAILLFSISFVFLRIDLRNKHLIKHSENVIIKYEDILVNENLKLFKNEEIYSSDIKSNLNYLNRHMYSHSQLYKTIYLIYKIIAIGIFISCFRYLKF